MGISVRIQLDISEEMSLGIAEGKHFEVRVKVISWSSDWIRACFKESDTSFRWQVDGVTFDALSCDWFNCLVISESQSDADLDAFRPLATLMAALRESGRLRLK